MSDPDLHEFYKGGKKARDYNRKMKKEYENRKNQSFIPSPLFPPSIPPLVPQWKEPQPPIDVVMNGNWPEWEWMGETFRPYFAGNLWINCTATRVYWAFRDRNTDTITKVNPYTVKVDTNGKQYVESFNKGVKIITYLEDALKVWPGTSLQTPPTHAPKSVSQPLPQQPSMLNRTLFPLDGEEFGFDHVEKFFVSKKNGRAAGLSVDWGSKTHNPDKAKRYNVFTRKDGRLAVNVKQSDGIYKEIDMATVICRTFYGDAPNGMVVKFKDGNPGNCDADNLYWDMP